MNKVVERAKMVAAMEFVVRQVNDESIFMRWLSVGVADEDIKYGDLDESHVPDYYLDDDVFKELMETFLNIMEEAKYEGGLYCGDIVTD